MVSDHTLRVNKILLNMTTGQLCVFFSAPGGPPQNISITVLNSTAIHVNWLPPLPEIQNGIIRQYTVNVKVIQTQTTHTAVPYITIDELHPYYNHEITVAAVTIEQGPVSDIITITTPEDSKPQIKSVTKLKFTMYSGPPLSVSALAVSSTSIWLIWAAPDRGKQNGIIRKYLITLHEIETDLLLHYEADGTATLQIINHLHPFYNYLCFISAFSIGTGPAATVEVQTKEEGTMHSNINAYFMHTDSSENAVTFSEITCSSQFLTPFPCSSTNYDGTVTWLYELNVIL